MKYLNLVYILVLIQQVFGKLKFVTQSYRHGARTPLYNNYDGEYQVHGILTGVGMRQQYGLGQILRQKYIDEEKFLSEDMNFDEFLLFSTDVDRTLQSATSNMLGFYPEGTGQKIYPNVETQYLVPPYKGVQYEDLGQEALPKQFQPAVIHTTTKDTNYLLYPYCKNESKQQVKFLMQKSLTIQKAFKELKPTLQSVRDILNDQELDTPDLFFLYDVFISDMYSGRPLPQGITPNSEVFQNITYAASYAAYFLQQDTKLLNIQNTNFFKNLTDNMDNCINNNSPLKWFMISAHDSNLQNFLPALNITSSQCVAQLFTQGKTDALNCQLYPKYASTLIIELHEYDDNINNYFVKINYNGEYQNLCEQEKIECNYEEFKQRLWATIQTQQEIDQQCDNLNENSDNQDIEIEKIIQKHNIKNSMDALKYAFKQASQIIDGEMQNQKIKEEKLFLSKIQKYEKINNKQQKLTNQEKPKKSPLKNKNSQLNIIKNFLGLTILVMLGILVKKLIK